MAGCRWSKLFYTTLQPAALNVALHVLFVLPAPSNAALDGTASPMHAPFPFVQKMNTPARYCIVVPAGLNSWGR